MPHANRTCAFALLIEQQLQTHPSTGAGKGRCGSPESPKSPYICDTPIVERLLHQIHAEYNLVAVVIGV